MDFVCPEMSTDGESLQSSKGLMYTNVDENSSCLEHHQGIPGNLEPGNKVNDCLHEEGCSQIDGQPLW
jgi:hypothetical protein